MLLDLEIQRATEITEVPGDEQFRQWAESALTGREGEYSLAIRVVDEVEALRYNREYRDRDYATNVLSFPAELPEGLPEAVRESQLGDLLICAPVVAREAREQQLPEPDHWAHLVIHGVLHLLGYDHQQDDDADVMEALENKILSGFGVANPYRDEV